MDAKNRISEIVSICQQHYWTFPTISVNHTVDSNFQIVLIGNGFNLLSSSSPDPGCKVFLMTESDLLDRILNRDAILTTLFGRAIVLKDDLHIMQLIMDSIPANRSNRRNRFHKGNIEITFHNVNSPHQFISKTFIPFMEISKTYLSKCPFIISSQMCNGRMDVSAGFFGIKHDFDMNGLKRILIKRVSELSLHSISIDMQHSCPSMSDYTADMMQEISDQFIVLYSQSEDIDAVVRNVVIQYLKVLMRYTDSIKECHLVNRQILDRMLPDSLSSISSEFLLHEDIADALDKIKKEYGEQFGNNRKIFFELICSSINGYQFIDNVVTGDAIYSDIQKLTFLENLYSDIFSASMMHPYYLAFIPFCINEVLKYEV